MRGTAPGMRAVGAVLLPALLAVAAWDGPAAAAGAGAAGERRVTQFDVEATIALDGRVEVVETIAYDLGAEPRPGMTRIIPAAVGSMGTRGKILPHWRAGRQPRRGPAGGDRAAG